MNIGTMPHSQVEPFIKNFREKLASNLHEGENEDFFIPIRDHATIQLFELDASAKHSPNKSSMFIIAAFDPTVTDQKRVDEFTAEFRQKLQNGDYTLMIEGEAHYIIPVPPDIIVDRI